PEPGQDRGRVPEDYGGVQPEAADRQPAQGDGVPVVLLPAAVQPDPGGACLRGGRAGAGPRGRLGRDVVRGRAEATDGADGGGRAGGGGGAGAGHANARAGAGPPEGPAGWAVEADLAQGGQQEAPRPPQQAQGPRTCLHPPRPPTEKTAKSASSEHEGTLIALGVSPLLKQVNRGLTPPARQILSRSRALRDRPGPGPDRGQGRGCLRVQVGVRVVV